MPNRFHHAGRALAALALLAILADAAIAQRGRGGPPGRARDDGAPKVGDNAPLFKLKTLDGKQEVDLKKTIKSKPVILFFGSYT
jgi:cytochrome oxidase Cu insertion factor (SCO1/SenC/PrrC family)